MPPTDSQLSSLQVLCQRRAVLEMEDLSARLAEIARAFVRTALESEVLDAGAEAWKQEGEQALRALLQDESFLDAEGPDATRLLESLKEGLDNPIPPDDDEIREHAAEVGSVLASSWLQFLALALRAQEEIQLGDTLLPQRGEVREELWDALRGSLSSLAIGVDEAQSIMRAFAEDVAARSAGMDLPMGIALDIRQGRRRSYVVRRR